MTTKHDLHHLIDELPDEALPAIQRLLQAVNSRGRDPLLEALMLAPWDNEPETPEEVAAVQEARKDRAAGRVVTHEEARRRLLHHP